ncbi:hypothetical protein D3C84_1252750 [compost metagenome]
MPDEVLEQFTVAKREIYYQKALSEGIEQIALLFVDHVAVGYMIIGHCRDAD